MHFLTTGEAAERCGVKINTIKRWIRAGLIKAVQTPGGHWRIPASEFDRFLQQQGMAQSRPARPAEPARVLIVDDDPLMHEFVNYAVEASVSGASVEHAYDGYSGLLMTGLFRPHLLVLDIMLPEINGLEIISRLREHEQLGGEMRILALTGANERKHVTRRLKEAQLDAVLFKPVGIGELTGTVGRLLGYEADGQAGGVAEA